MAQRSAKFAAVIFRPISNGEDQSRRKCTPSTAISVVTTLRWVVVTTAASSPIPTTILESGRAKTSANWAMISPSEMSTRSALRAENPLPVLRKMR